MKIEVSELNSTYKKCEINGKFREKNEVDMELIKSLKKVSEESLAFIKKKSKDIEESSVEWTFVFRDYYESLRILIEAYLLFDKIEAESHECKNAYLCFKHKELELDWEFLETARLKRNYINYKGQLLNHQDWKLFKLNFDLHISKLKKEIEKKLKESTKKDSDN